MTPEQFDAIRERNTKGIGDGDPYAVVTTSAREAHDDRGVLLAYVDTLERLNKGLRGVAGRALHDRARLTGRAANLLAHQQARALELAAERFRYSTALDTIASLECDSDDLADACGCASCRAHEALASSDELSEIAIRDTELATLRSENGRLTVDLTDYRRRERDYRAENERLHRANVDLVAQASSREHDRKQLRAENARFRSVMERVRDHLREWPTIYGDPLDWIEAALAGEPEPEGEVRDA